MEYIRVNIDSVKYSFDIRLQPPLKQHQIECKTKLN